MQVTKHFGKHPSRPGRYTYYVNDAGELHRTDGPAIEYANGNKSWYVDGKLHRTDGPAIEYDGHKYWYLNGVKQTK